MQQKEKNNKRLWSIEIGLYPGVLFGVRSYDTPNSKIHVLYLPFIDIALYLDGR
jgi:hypothetical protein